MGWKWFKGGVVEDEDLVLVTNMEGSGMDVVEWFRGH